MVTRRRAFTLFRNGCLTLDIAASSTPTSRIPHQIPSTGELDIEPSEKLSAIALRDLQAERVADLRKTFGPPFRRPDPAAVPC
jgi:hypothetical protein